MIGPGADGGVYAANGSAAAGELKLGQVEAPPVHLTLPSPPLLAPDTPKLEAVIAPDEV